MYEEERESMTLVAEVRFEDRVRKPVLLAHFRAVHVAVAVPDHGPAVAQDRKPHAAFAGTALSE